MGDVLILAEVKESGLEKSTFELITLAKQLAKELEGKALSIVLGKDPTEAGQELRRFALDSVYKVQDPALEGFVPEVWLNTLEQVIKELRPQVFLMTHSPVARDILPRLGLRLNSTVTMDCVEVKVDPSDKRLLRKKPIYGGNAMAVLKCKGTPEIVSLRKNSYPMAQADGQVSELKELTLKITKDLVTQVLETKKRDIVELDKAEVIISGGRGLAEKEDFSQLEQLAAVLEKKGIKAMVGCSRPIVDKGWMSSDRQVGLTGTMVAPNVYIAIGISGAIQHLVGMVRSKKIIAINTDAGCNMFKVADYGLTEDYKEILPLLIKKLEETL
jgi:electron transfer flavoprotein alpha subunit